MSTKRMREASEVEQAAWLAGHLSIEGAVETEHGLMVPAEIQIGDHVKSDAFRGIALVVVDWDKEWVQDQTWIPYDEDCSDEHWGDPKYGSWEDDPYGEGEEVERLNSDQCFVVMVGDDQRYLTDYDDLVKIDDDEYCGICGQLGCGHYL